jgi:hemin uptake protein HemP
MATPRRPALEQGSSRPPPLREVPIETILGAEREAVIVHNGVRYRLRITSNDKLILTK